MSDESVAGTSRSTTDADQALRVRPVRVGPISPEVAALLRRVHALERDPSVGDRNAAFALMRALLGGARRAGYSGLQLAKCLDISVGTLRTRAYNDGWISEATFAEMADLDIGAIRRWRRAGKLPHRSKSDNGEPSYLASELLMALAQPPPRRSVS